METTIRLTCCFIGHREIEDTPQLRKKISGIVSKLIKSGAVNFIFGDHSAFDSLCYEIVSKAKESHPQIKRINYRNNYEDADGYTMQFLLMGYEESVCPAGVGSAGKASYIKRNQAMICASDICVFYYDKNYNPPKRKVGKKYLTAYQPKSGTALAYDYAQQKKKRICNVFENIKIK